MAINENKALIAFTDGADTEGIVSVEAIIEKANELNVPVYGIGLGNNLEMDVLAQIAYETNGTVMQAEDAVQLIALYTSLSQLLRGGVNLFKLRVTVDKENINSGVLFQFLDLIVSLPEGDKIRLPILIEK